MKYFIILLIASGSISLFAQTPTTSGDWMEYIEDLQDADTEESAFIENLTEELSYLSEHPFDLHSVTKQDLERLPFLSAIQIENLLYYIYRNTPLVSIYELKNVPELDLQTIRYLLPFVYIGVTETSDHPLKIKNAPRYGKHSLLLRSDYCLQPKAGYADASSEEKEKSPNKYYLGEPFYASVKYDFQYKQRILIGLAGEKDPGEPFFNKTTKGFDFYSFNLTLKDFGIIKAFYLGDYRLSFGQGLVLNTDFSIGKSADVLNVGKKGTGIKRHFSTSENGFFRGAAIVLGSNSVQLSLFGSHRNVDANADSSTIFTFKTDGYHRIPGDLEKRNQATINTVGGNLFWRNGIIDIGLTGTYYSFGGKTVDPNARPYNLFYLRGKEGFNLGVNYNLRTKKYSIQGETAMDINNKIATSNMLGFNLSSSLGFMLAYRYFDPEYQAQFARSFSEASGVQNESGIYYGLKWQFLSHWNISTYIDFFKFPWLKYGIDGPSEGKDLLIQLSFKPNDKINMNGRYKLKEKSSNEAGEKKNTKVILPYQQHRLRYQLNFTPNGKFSFRSQLDYNRYESSVKPTMHGRSFSQSAGYIIPHKTPFRIDLGLAWFKTDSWDVRISAHEKNILYAFSFPSYYGEGIRGYLTARYDLFKNLCFYFKCGSTFYFDRNVISSGTEAIEGKHKTDLQGLVRWKF